MLHSETMGGTRDPIAFLHGIGGTTRYWKARVQPLASSHRLIFVDLLGYGQSPKPWTKYTVDRHVDELYQVLYEQKSQTIVGHSFGGIVTMAFAVRYPHIVRCLIFISLPYFGNREGAMHYFRNSHSADRYVMTNIAFAAIACMITRQETPTGLIILIISSQPRVMVSAKTGANFNAI